MMYFLYQLKQKIDKRRKTFIYWDNLPMHKSQVVKEWCHSNKIKIIRCIPYHPRAHCIEYLFNNCR